MKKEMDKIKAPNPDNFWPDAENMLDKHFQRKRRNKWIVLALLAGVGLMTTLYFINKENGTTTAIKNENAIKLPENSSLNTSLKKDASYNNNLIKKEQSKLNEINSTVLDKNITIVESTNKSNKNTVELNESAIKLKDIASEPLKANSIKSPNSPSIKLADSKTIEKSKESSSTEINAEVEKIKALTSPLSFEELQNKKVVDDNKINDPRIKISLLPSTPIRLFPRQTSILLLDNNKTLNLSTTSAAKKTNGIAISLYAGMHSISKHLSADTKSDYLNRRQTEEKSIIVPEIGINVIASKNNFSTSIGIEYSKFGEKTSYSAYSRQTQYTQRGAWNPYTYTVIDVDTALTNGLQWFLETPVSVLDSTYDVTTDSSKVKVYDPSIQERNSINKFQYIEIPLTIGYQYPMKRFGLGISAGISPAWMISQSGYYLKEDESGVKSISSSKPMNTFFLNGKLSIDVIYHMSPYMKLFVSPQWKTNLGQLSNLKQEVKTRYTGVGANVGMSYLIR